MNPLKLLPTLLAGALLSLSFTAGADGLSREQVRMDRDAFLSMMRWDELTGMWVLKPGFEPPAGIKTRAEVIRMREEFLRMNRYDESTSSWVPLKSAREMSTLSRDQVNMETVRFTMMYRWDEQRSEWLPRNR
jgi:hypothetical protein